MTLQVPLQLEWQTMLLLIMLCLQLDLETHRPLEQVSAANSIRRSASSLKILYDKYATYDVLDVVQWYELFSKPQF